MVFKIELDISKNEVPPIKTFFQAQMLLYYLNYVGQ